MSALLYRTPICRSYFEELTRRRERRTPFRHGPTDATLPRDRPRAASENGKRGLQGEGRHPESISSSIAALPWPRSRPLGGRWRHEPSRASSVEPFEALGDASPGLDQGGGLVLVAPSAASVYLRAASPRVPCGVLGHSSPASFGSRLQRGPLRQDNVRPQSGSSKVMIG